MKSTKGMLSMALVALALTLTPRAVSAQATPAGQDAPAEAKPAAAEQPADAKGWLQLKAALDSEDAGLAALEALTDLSPEHIQVVAVAELVASDAAASEAVTETVTAKNEQVSALRAALAAQPAAVEALKEADATAEQVVAVHVAEDGKVVLFYE